MHALGLSALCAHCCTVVRMTLLSPHQSHRYLKYELSIKFLSWSPVLHRLKKVGWSRKGIQVLIEKRLRRTLPEWKLVPIQPISCTTLNYIISLLLFLPHLGSLSHELSASIPGLTPSHHLSIHSFSTTNHTHPTSLHFHIPSLFGCQLALHTIFMYSTLIPFSIYI